jgi:hypothetical protein
MLAPRNINPISSTYSLWRRCKNHILNVAWAAVGELQTMHKQMLDAEEHVYLSFKKLV